MERHLPVVTKQEIEEIPGKNNVLIVLGKQLSTNPLLKTDLEENEYGLSIESIVTSLAAGYLLYSGEYHHAIFSGGVTTPDLPSEAHAMWSFMKNKVFPQLVDSERTLEEVSFNTTSNAVEVRKILDSSTQQSMPQTTVLTTGFHTRRARKSFEREGVQVSTILSADEVLKEYNQSYRDWMHAYQHSFRYRIEQVKELALNTVFDNKKGRELVFAVTKSKRTS